MAERDEGATGSQSAMVKRRAGGGHRHGGRGGRGGSGCRDSAQGFRQTGEAHPCARQHARPRIHRRGRYVDPGNVAANLTSGAQYGYLLVWVLVLANCMAVLIQYQASKLGIVTGKSLPQILGERMGSAGSFLFFAQAEVIAIATDLAEVIGGAIALNLLFGLPLLVGGLIIGAVSTVLLLFQGGKTHKIFERLVIGLLLVITFGFIAGLFMDPPNPLKVAEGLIPRFNGGASVLMAASMLGATVMPHAIYLHSTLVNDHYAHKAHKPSIKEMLHGSRIDVVWALALAGSVNIALLVLAANSLHGMGGTDTIEGAQHTISQVLGLPSARCSRLDCSPPAFPRPRWAPMRLGDYEGVAALERADVGVPHHDACAGVGGARPDLEPHRSVDHRSGGAVDRHSVCGDSLDAIYAQQTDHG